MNSDFADFFIIGGVAYNFHAPPRATKDIDVWVRPKRSNLEKPVNALGEFGLPTEAIDIESWA